MNFFSDPQVLLSDKLLEVVYIVMGLIVFALGIHNFTDKSNPHRFGTGIFWSALGIVIGAGRFLSPLVNGIIIIIMTLPAIFNQVTKGHTHSASKEYMIKMADKVGNKVFIPALCIGFVAILTALFTKLGALVGVGIGVVLAIIILMFLSKDNKPHVFLEDSFDMLATVGPLSMLPMLLASLGAVFTQAGVGKVISSAVSSVVPTGNINIGIILYAIGMVLFTMIMGNAFAAITVMTVGIGAPFVLTQGGNPTLITMTALTCGFCGTLLTPMAANFNIVPVAILEMKDKYGVIKSQALIAIIMLVLQIIYMILFK